MCKSCIGALKKKPVQQSIISTCQKIKGLMPFPSTGQGHHTLAAQRILTPSHRNLCHQSGMKESGKKLGVQYALSGATRSHVQQQPELACPLCRGHIEGWIVVEAARNFMNSKTRSCALETCNFTGNYAELRKHARLEHPSERPCEADPTRQSEWTRLEHQRNFEDDFSEYQAPSDDDSSGDDFLAELSLDGGLFDSEAEEGLDEDINISLDFELQTDFEDAFSESDDDSSEDDFLTEQPLDGGIFDSEAEEGLDEDINISLDFELELSFSFPSEFPSMPRTRDRSPSYARGGNTYLSESGARSQNRRSRRLASSSDNHERRPTATRSTNLSSRRTPNTQSSSRERRRNR